MSELTNSRSPRCPSWHWRPRPFTLAVVGCVLAIAFLANFPAVDVPHAELRDGKFGLHFNLTNWYEHGWPARYVRRELSQRTSAEGPPVAWRPWEGPGQWSIANLLLDLGLWSLVLVAAAVAAQYWRSQRRAIWQLGLRDLLILTGVAGLACAWIAATRVDYLREQSLLAAYRERTGNPGREHEAAASVPAWLSDSLQGRYRRVFNRTCYYRSDGDSDLACQHPHLIALRETAFHKDFPRHLRQMSRLEALDLSFVKLPYSDATRQATILKSLSPHSNLRGINLHSTNATDADMAWLASCPRLEVIDLTSTKIGDHGLAHLAKLPRLRTLTISSDRISDAGCRSIAQIAALEELSLASRNIHEAGASELARLPKLRKLKITAQAPVTFWAELQERMPECEVKADSYR